MKYLPLVLCLLQSACAGVQYNTEQKGTEEMHTKDSDLINISLQGQRVEINVSKSKWNEGSSKFLEVKNMEDDEARLVFSISSSEAYKVEAKLVQDFQGLATLENDIAAAGFKKEDAFDAAGKPQEINNYKIKVFSWTTPTIGSAVYFYIESPHRRSVALKIGPFASGVAKDFDFKWSEIKWTMPSEAQGAN